MASWLTISDRLHTGIIWEGNCPYKTIVLGLGPDMVIEFVWGVPWALGFSDSLDEMDVAIKTTAIMSSLCVLCLMLQMSELCSMSVSRF